MRTDWDTYFIQLAFQAATRATCPRLQVGAVIVKHNKIVSTGYNGAPSGEPHCTDEGCLMVGRSCKRTIHAEDNAISHSSRLDRAGSTLYLTDNPCIDCADKIVRSGISEVVYSRVYIKGLVYMLPLFNENGIVVRRIPG